MSKQIVRVKERYPDREFVGVEAVILRRDKESVLLGFPLEGSIGWHDSAYSTEYRCWWISSDYLEPITTITRSKFK